MSTQKKQTSIKDIAIDEQIEIPKVKGFDPENGITVKPVEYESPRIAKDIVGWLLGRV